MVLTNFNLEDIAEQMGLDLIGIYSKDELPDRLIAGSYIINLQDSDDGQGSHWVCFKIFENGKCCYFDSFGMPMPVEVDNFLKPFKPVATNNRIIQDVKSTKCGYFCIAFINYFNGVDAKCDIFEMYDDFLNAFSNNSKLNDKIVMELLDK